LQKHRSERDRGFSILLISAQPSRSVSYCKNTTAPPIPQPRDYQAIDKLQIQHTPVALKYSGLAELEGFILPTLRLVVVTDREFFGQHPCHPPAIFSASRRRSKQVDPTSSQQVIM